MENQEPVVTNKNGSINERELTGYFKKLDEYIIRLEKNIEAVADNGFKINMLEERTSQNSRLIDRILYDIGKLKETISAAENKIYDAIKKNKFRERMVWAAVCMSFTLIGFFGGASSMIYVN